MTDPGATPAALITRIRADLAELEAMLAEIRVAEKPLSPPETERWIDSGIVAQRLRLSKSRITSICRTIDDPTMARKPRSRWEINSAKLDDFARVTRVS